MKLRLYAGSLRLRLSRSEVERLQESGRVEDAVQFAPGSALVYAIETGNGKSVAAAFRNGNISVTVPSTVAAKWFESDQTSIEESGGELRILIEKDFQCLHRPPEPGEDSFPNPLASSE